LQAAAAAVVAVVTVSGRVCCVHGQVDLLGDGRTACVLRAAEGCSYNSVLSHGGSHGEVGVWSRVALDLGRTDCAPFQGLAHAVLWWRRRGGSFAGGSIVITVSARLLRS
jgi:hypothetical protein